MSTFSTVEEVKKSYALKPCALYEYESPDSIQPLDTCPLNSRIMEVSSPWTTDNRFHFKMTIGKTSFVNQAIRFNFTIPLVATLTDDAVPTITAENFLAEVFDNNEDIVYSQYDILQALQNLEISLNGESLFQLANISDTLLTVSPYYSSNEVARWFGSSQMDRFPTFDTYTAATGQVYSYYNENDELVTTQINVDSDNNIFKCTFGESYQSRTPEYKFVSSANKKNCKFLCTFNMLLPLSFGTLPIDQESALSGIEELIVNMNFRHDIASFLFNTKSTHIAKIELDTTNYAGSKGTMLTQIYTPPGFMQNRMIHPVTRLLNPYSVSIPRFMVHTSNVIQCKTGGAVQSFNVVPFTISQVPSAIYVALQKIKKGDFATASKTPISFGRIKNMTVSVDSATTNFTSTKMLKHLAESNGYDITANKLSMLSAGFPIKLDLKKDLSLPGDFVVGMKASLTLTIDGNFFNQRTSPSGENAVNEDYRVVIIIVNDANLSFDGAKFSIDSGVNIQNSMMDEKHFLPALYQQYQTRVSVIGGNWFKDKLWPWLKGAAKTVWNNRDAIASTVGNVANLIGKLKGGELSAGCDNGGRSMMYSNVSGGGTKTLGAGTVKKTVFK